jgi:hypothetical protein|tara:strand:+ start:186 stop:632 length:447 start_codon:yes stop_codon:yes gene_type:complete
VERAIKEIVSSAELTNLYEDIAKNLLANESLQYQQNLFLISIEKSLSFLADEILEKVDTEQNTSINKLSLIEKWKTLAAVDSIKNLVLPEIGHQGILNQIETYYSILNAPIKDNVISSDSSLDLKKMNMLLDKLYRWKDLLRKTLDEC